MRSRTPSLLNRILRLTAALGLLATTIVWTAPPASAAILIVNSTADVVDQVPGNGSCDTGNTVGVDPECTLRAAIQEANALSGADTITLPVGTYTLSIGTLGENAATQGDLDITSDITIDGAGAGTTIIQAGTTNLNGIDRVFDVLAGGVLDVSDVTIRYGRADDGAGIQSIGTVIVEDAIVAENTAAKVGGGINLKGSGTSLTVRRTQFLANSADDGGGVGVKDGTSLIEDSTFSANTASRRGGGIHNDSAPATITGSTFVGNSALTEDGGGILNRGGGSILNLTNSTLSGNSAVRDGGGLSNESTVALLNVTITANTASDSGGGVRVQSGTVTAKNTIVAGNTTGGNCSNSVTSQGYNLEDTDTCGFNQTGDQINATAALGPLQGNGGPTETHGLLSGSDAIDAGTNVGAPAVDQRGTARPIDGDGDATATVDVGSFEAPPVNNPPTDIGLVPAVVGENVPVGTVVGTLTTADPDPGDTHAYALVAGAGDRDNGLLTIVGDQLQTAAALDFEALGSPLNIRVETTDSGAGNLTFEEALTVTLTDVNEAPLAGDDIAANNVLYSVPRGDTLTVGATHSYVTAWGSLGAGAGQFDKPEGVAVDASGNVYVVDGNNHRVQRFDSIGTFIAQWGSFGAGPGLFAKPTGIAVDGSGNVYVADSSNNRIQKFNGNGTFIAQWGGFGVGAGQFNKPEGLTVDGAGNVCVADGGNNRIQKFDGSGTFISQWGSFGAGPGMFSKPTGVAVDGAGNVYVADSGNNRIQKFDGAATFLTEWGSSGAGPGMFNKPNDVHVDAYSDVFVADATNDRVQKFDSTGTFLTEWGSFGVGAGQLDTPLGLVVDGAGTVFVADSNNNRIQRFSAVGSILANDSDPESNPITVNDEDGATPGIQPVAGPINGTLTLYADGTFTYTHDGSPTNSDTFTYRATDGTGQSNVATVEIVINSTVPPVNNPPTDIALAPSTVAENVPVGTSVGTLSTTDPDPGDTHTYTLVAGVGDGNNGLFTIVGDQLQTAAALDFEALGSPLDIRVETTDSGTGNLTFEEALTVTLTDVNETPVANDDAAGVAEDVSVVINVKVNDTDAEDGIPGGPAAVVTQPLHGTAVANISGIGTMTYTPDPEYYGPDSFTYTIDDTGGETSNVATVTVTVAGFPDPPTANDDGPYTVLEDGSLVVPAHGQQFSLTWGSSGSGNGQFLGPRGVAVAPDGSVYVVDTGTDRIQKFDDAGTYLLQWGTTGTGNSQFDTPFGVALAEDGTVYIADGFNDRIQYFDPNGAYLGQFGTTGTGDGQLDSPRGIDFGPDGNLYVADAYNHRVQAFAPDGTYLRKWGIFGTGDGQFDAPRDLAVDVLGDVYVADSFNHRIQKFDSAGTYLLQWGTNGTADGEFDFPRGMDLDAAGNIFITDSSNDRVQIFDNTGTFLHTFGTAGTGNGQFTNTYGLAFGLGGDLYVGDVGGARIQRFSLIGILANDVDPDHPNETLTASVDTDVSNGTLVLNPDGTFTYDPDPDYFGPDSFVYQVCDLLAACDTATVSITVDPVNDEPSFTPGVNIGLGEDNGPVTIPGWATAISPGPSNESAQTLTFNVTGNTNPGLFSSAPGVDAVTGDLAFTPAANQFGAATITIDLQDNGGTANGGDDTSGSAVFTITVNSVNDAPSFMPGGNASVDEDSGPYAAGWATAISPGPSNESAQTLTFNVTGNTNPGLFSSAPAVDAVTGDLAFTPAANQFGAATITIDLQDNGGTANGGDDTSGSAVFTITVGVVNDAPVLDPVGAQSGDEGTLITFTATASDVDVPADTLTFTLEDGLGSVPAGASIAVGGVFTFTPSESQGSGVYSFDVVVTDDGLPNLEDRETITVTVDEVNVAPVLGPVGPQTTDELALLFFTATASDTDLPGNGLTFALGDGAGSVPAGASITAGGVFTFTPSEAQGSGVYSFDVVVTDDGLPNLEDRETITVTVDEVNSAPVANPIGDRFPNEGATVSLTATAFDNDVPANGLLWSQDSGPGTVDGAGNYSWVTGEADGPGTYTVVLRVTDDGSPNLDDTVSFDITVAEIDAAPVLDPVGAQSGDEGTLIGFTATATDGDVPGSVTFTLEDGAGSIPAGASITAGGVFTWSPSEAQGPGVYSFDVVVTDNTLLSDRETVTVTVNETNIAPILNPLPNPTQSENTFITFTASATDGDVPANILSYSLVGAPPGATINPGSGAFVWIPTEAQGPGVYTFDVVVTDDGVPSLTDTDSVTITVVEFNRDPVLDPVGARSGDEGTSIGFTATATDLDQPANLLTFTLEDGPGAVPPGASITAGGVFTWTPTEAQGPGVYTFDVVVTDDGAPVAEDRETITVTVDEANVAPSLDPVGPRAGDEGTVIAFTATASDPDLPPELLTFTLGGAPAGASITAGGVFGWIPNEMQGPGLYVFDVIVTDDGAPNLEDRETITVTVGEVDTAPTLNPIGDRSVDEGSLLVFAVTSSDPDVPNNRTYSLEDGPGSVPAGAGIDPLLGLFGWSPTEAQGPGVNTFDVVVTDNAGLRDRETITVTVAEINQAPVLDPVGDLSATELVPLTFSATASDPDDPANTLTFSLSGGPVGAAITSGGAFSWTPTEAQGPGTFTFDVVVTDDGPPASADSETITVTVGEVNAAPALGPIGDRVVDEEALVAFVAVATDPDVPLDTLTYSLIGAPAGASIDPAVGAFSWTPTEAQGPGSYSFTFVVVDASGASDSETITMSVAEVNLAPTIVDPGDQVGGEGLPVNLALVGADGDEPANLLTWSSTGLPDGLAIDPVTGVISGIVAEGAASTSPFAVTIDLADDGAPPLAGSTSFDWTVAPNTAPAANPDFYEIGPGSTLTIGVPGVLGNDVDPDGDILAANLLVPPSAGTLAFSPTGGFTYIHNGGGTVEDVFVYEVDDGRGGLSLATVKISILEPNLPPILTDDLLSILEDGVGSIAPLVNDSDPNGDPLILLDFTQPEFGLLSASADGTLAFTPPGDFFGQVTSVYTASDGKGGVATGVVSIVVSPVNDLPIGRRDVATLDTYLPFVLDVLGNDRDIDSDILSVVGVLGVAIGEVAVNPDGTLTYRPATGFVGTDTFRYQVSDGAGGVDTVSVSITVPEEVLAVAIARGEDIGTPSLGFQAPDADVGEGPSITFGLTQGVSLVADAFFQSLGALQLPILFLGLALGSVVVLGGFTELPMLLATRRRRYYSVVLLGREHRLAARVDAGPDESAVYFYEPTAAGFQSLDKPVKRDGGSWIPVESPNGAGWVEARYLTETVDLEFFLDDERPVEMLRRLAHDLLGRKDISSLFSSRGLALALGNDPEIFEPQAFQAALANRYGSDDSRRLWETALEPLGAALRAAGDEDLRSSHSRAALIPVELWNFQYLTVNVAGHPPWLVYFEYDKGRPKIVGIGLDV